MEKNKMLRLIVVIVICIVVVVGFYIWFSWADREQEKLKNSGGENANYIIEYLSTYEDTANGVSFKYPSDWDKGEVQDGVMGFAHESGANITFVVEDLSENPVSLEEYTKSAIDGLDDLDLNIELLTSESTVSGLEDYPSYTITYTAQSGSMNTKAKAMWIVANQKAYVMTYTASEEKYEEYLPMGDQAMESISIQ